MRNHGCAKGTRENKCEPDRDLTERFARRQVSNRIKHNYEQHDEYTCDKAKETNAST
ncbi:MAG: hypothetical protein ABII13_01175 [Patescibacteria group bacterium]